MYGNLYIIYRLLTGIITDHSERIACNDRRCSISMCGSDNDADQHTGDRHMVTDTKYRHSNDRQHYRRSDRRYSRHSECYLYTAYRLPQNDSSDSERITGPDHRSSQRMCRQHHNNELYASGRHLDDLRFYSHDRRDNGYRYRHKRRYNRSYVYSRSWLLQHPHHHCKSCTGPDHGYGYNMCGPDNNAEHAFNRRYLEHQSAGYSNDRFRHRCGDRSKWRSRFSHSNGYLYITNYVPYDTGSYRVRAAISYRRIPSGM